MLIADIKTYDSSNIHINHLETTPNQVYQIEQYCMLIEGQNYDLSNTIKAIIHIDRQNIPFEFIEFLWIIISFEIEDQQYQKELNEENHDLEHQYSNDDMAFFDLVIADKGIRITYWK